MNGPPVIQNLTYFRLFWAKVHCDKNIRDVLIFGMKLLNLRTQLGNKLKKTVVDFVCYILKLHY